MTAERYYVRRPTGKVFGPFDKNAIQLMLKSNKLDANAEVSQDKNTWQSLAEVPDFAQHVRGAGAPGGTIMGMAAVTMDDLPGPVRPGQGGYADLPRPAGGADLPRSAGDGADLPRSTSGKGFGDLPRPAGVPDLPRPTGGGVGLPRPSTGGPGLPIPSNTGLPQPGAGLPQPARPPLPTPSTRPPAPSHEIEDDLFGGPAPDLELDEDDLFGGPVSDAQEDDLFGPPPAQQSSQSPFIGNDPSRIQEDDLFGGDDHFSSNQVGGGQSDDLFGGPPSMMDSDDLFGGPSPGQAQAQAAPQPRGDDDLFGEDPRALEADDLFGGGDAFGGDEGSESLYGDDDDFLGGSQGFSFLDDGGSRDPGPQAGSPQASRAGAQDDWEQDLLNEATQQESWHDDLLTGNAPPIERNDAYAAPSPSPYASPSPGAPSGSAPPPQMASSGIPSQQIASSGPRHDGAAPSAAQDPAKQGSADSDKKRNKMVMIGLPILAILIIAVAGLAIQRFLQDDSSGQNNVVKEVKAFTLDYDALKAPNYAEVQQLIVQSKKGGAVTEQNNGRLLLAHALMTALHDDQASLQAGQALSKQLAAGKSPDALLGKGAMLIAEGKPEDGEALLQDLVSEEGGVGAFANLFLGIQSSRQFNALQQAARKSGDIAPTKEAPPTIEDQEANEQAAGEADQGADMQAPAAPEPGDEITQAKDDALAHFKKASGFLPTLSSYFTGELHEKGSDMEQATALYKKATESDKEFVPAQVALGRVLYKQGELNAAISALDKVNTELVQYGHPTEKGEALHYAGQVYSARSQHKEAIDFFTRALASDPSRSDTLRALAEEYERAQQYSEALNFFRTNKKLGQSDPDVMLGIVRAHIGLKEWPQAIAQLEVGEKKFPTDARFSYYLGELNRRRGAFFEAQKSLERAVEIDPALLMAHAMLAQFAWSIDHDAERGNKHIQEIVSRPEKIDARVATEVAEYYKIAGNYDLAKQWYNAAIKRDPNYWAARLPLAKLLLEKGETDNALQLLERSRNEGVTDIKLSAYLADAYRQSKMYYKAIEEINRVIEKVPSKDTAQRAEYIFIRGRIHFDQGNYDTALEDFNQAFTLNTNFYDANFYVGRTKLAQGDTATAIKIFRSVIDYLPNNGEYRFAMGEALQKEGRKSQALTEYRKVTEVDPGYGVRNPKVYITRGRLLSELDYSREGRKDVQKALELAPTMVDALIAMGEVDFREQKYEDAIQNLTKALNKEPNHAPAQQKLGMSYIYLEKLREGSRHLELAIKYDYPDPDIYRTLGYVYKQLGERSLAKKAFEAFLQESLTTEQPLGTTREVRRQIEELGG